MNPTGALRLLPDLKFTPHVQGKNRWYAVEDPQSGRFLKLGFTEYLVVSCLQNGLLPGEISKTLEKHDMPAEQAQEHVAMTISWLVRNGLLLTDNGPKPDAPAPAQPSTPSSNASSKKLTGVWALDPFFVKLPILSGNFTERLARPMCYLLSPWSAVVLAALAIAALYCIVTGADRFFSLEQKLFVDDGRMWWVAAWLLLKAVHELGHAVAAIRIGSRIRSSGLHLIYLGPVPYIDVTDMWTISTRRHRVLVSSCGMLFEFAVACAAVIVATVSESPQVQYFCAALATLGTVTTFAFNANPLMRFDGYYIVSDWLGRPNLWTEAQTAVRDFVARILNPFAPSKVRIKWGLVAYGIACTISRVLVMLTLAWWLLTVWDGVGVLIALWGAYCWFFRPWYLKKGKASKPAPQAGPAPAGMPSISPADLAKLMACCGPSAPADNAQNPTSTVSDEVVDDFVAACRERDGAQTGAATARMPEGASTEAPPTATPQNIPPELLQALLASQAAQQSAGAPTNAEPEPKLWWQRPVFRVAYFAGLAGLFVLIAFMPSPWGLRAPGVIGFANPTTIRSTTDGFLVELPIADRQLVKAGDLLARLENRELLQELEQTRLKLETSMEQVSGYRARGELAMVQTEQAKLESLSEHFEQLKTRAQGLDLRAPHDGMIVLATADKILGRFMQPGQPLCMVVNPNQLEVRALASQRDSSAFLENEGKVISVRSAVGFADSAKLVSIDRRGSDICPEPVLAANYGGPLTVQVGVDRNGAPELKLDDARFEVIAELSPDASNRWVPGQLVSVALSGSTQRVWQAVWDSSIDMIRKRAATN